MEEKTVYDPNLFNDSTDKYYLSISYFNAYYLEMNAVEYLLLKEL